MSVGKRGWERGGVRVRKKSGWGERGSDNGERRVSASSEREGVRVGKGRVGRERL